MWQASHPLVHCVVLSVLLSLHGVVLHELTLAIVPCFVNACVRTGVQGQLTTISSPAVKPRSSRMFCSGGQDYWLSRDAATNNYLSARIACSH